MIRPLAKEVNIAVERGLADCRNLGLILDKFQPYEPVNEQQPGGMWKLLVRIKERKRVDGQTIWRDGLSDDSAARGLWFNGPPLDESIQIVDPKFELKPNTHISKAELAPVLKRWKHGVEAAGAEVFTMWTESPLIIGLGAKGTLETAITLHPLYGFPYLPGSALKGIARAAAFFALAEKLGIEGVDNETFLKLKKAGKKTDLQKLVQALDEDEESKWPECLKAEQQVARHFRELFGWRSAAGKVIFFDGMPARVPMIVSEVMTPHFAAFYSGDGAPHDADKPKPISFLAIARETPFGFAVGWRRGPKDQQLYGKAIDWLTVGLTEIGLGGKTAAGYGFFSAKDPGPSREPVLKSEADVSSYRPPRPDPVGNRPGGSKEVGLRPGSERTVQAADEYAANLARLAAEAEAKEKARLARKEEKKKRGKK